MPFSTDLVRATSMERLDLASTLLFTEKITTEQSSLATLRQVFTLESLSAEKKSLFFSFLYVIYSVNLECLSEFRVM